MRPGLAVIGIVLVVLVQCTESMDKGFDLFFTSNKRTFRDYSVYFRRSVPPWLRGNYIRNGLGRFEWGARNFTHAFDGYAKLASWKFDGTRVVKFTTRFVKSQFYSASKSANKIAPYLLFESTVPPYNLFEKFISLYRGIDNTNVNVFKFGGPGKNASFVAVSDFWQNYEFDPDTLNTIRRVNAPLPVGQFYNKEFPLPSSAHPVKEYGTNNHISFLSILNPFPGVQSSINVIRIKTADSRELIASIPRDNLPYMHSFGLSRNHAVIFANPLFINPWKMLKSGKAVKSLDWHPDQFTDIYVVDIRTGVVRYFQSDAVFNMHHVNSFEEGGKLHVDMVTYPDVSFITGLELATLRNPRTRDQVTADAFLRRYTFDLKTNTADVVEFPRTPGLEFVNELDLPVINQNYLHRTYCYVYGIVTKSDGIHLANVTLVKKDVCNGGNDRVWQHVNHYPSEPWFIPDPEGSAEDDGMLISVILDGTRRESYLLCLDPITMEEVNTASLPTAIPFSLHGRFFHEHL